MKSEKISNDWSNLIKESWIAKIDATPFMQRCQSREVTTRELLQFAIQHFHYARHFTRYLCALIANIENEDDRSLLADNLFEEMGLGDFGEVPHAKLYAQTLAAWNLDPSVDLPTTATKSLVSAMLGECMRGPWSGLGALCLGAEAIVPHLYSRIIVGFKSVGIKDDELEFFSLHVEADDEHAHTMKGIIDRALAEKPERRRQMMQGAERVIDSRCQFLDSISDLSSNHYFQGGVINEIHV